MLEQPTISTHVLDAEHGRPAAGVGVVLMRVDGPAERVVGRGMTDTDGRIRSLLDTRLETGTYRIEFELAGSFYAAASATFRVDDTSRSYHVPLLIAPYSLTT